MKIALIGYGKMGRILEQIATKRGHEVVLKLDMHNPEDFEKLHEADVAIEFTRPESAASNLKKCFQANVPVVCGTTGWLEKYDDMTQLCKKHDSAFLYSSNYSIGVNIFFAINKQLAAMMNRYDMYDVSMEEIHHTQKVDAPSGTAITLAEGILNNFNKKKNWVCREENDSNTEGVPKDSILINALRIDPTPGTHTIKYQSMIDAIEIKHIAHSREGFATGAVLAAEWLKDKKGVFSMQDLLGF